MRKSAMYVLAAVLVNGCGATPPANEQPDQPPAITANVDDSIKSFMSAMQSVGPDAREKYAKALEQLRHRGPEAVTAIIAKYNDLPRAAAMQRWSFLHALGELGGDKAIEHLAAVAAEPLPAKPSGSAAETEDDATTEVEAEIKLHLRALGGLADNLQRGSAAAGAGVVGAIKNGPSVLREMAAAEYLRGTNRSAEALAVVQSLLTADERERVLHPIKPLRHGPPPQTKNPSPLVESLPQKKP
jgi:hypothetical protein